MLGNIRGFGWRRARRVGDARRRRPRAAGASSSCSGSCCSSTRTRCSTRSTWAARRRWSDLIFALTVAVISFTSLESAVGAGRRGAHQPRRAQAAGRQRHRRRSCSCTSASRSSRSRRCRCTTATPQLATRYLERADGRHRRADAPALAGARRCATSSAGSAALTLVAAANSAMLGLSRLAYSLSTNRQIPSGLGRLHPQRSTPYVLIILAGLIAAGLVVPEDLDFLSASTRSARCWRSRSRTSRSVELRYSEPDARPALPRSRCRSRCAAASCRCRRCSARVVSAAGWVAVMVVHEPARYVGLGWMVGGHRAVRGLPPRRRDARCCERVTVSPQVLRAEPPRERDYGSILVPLFGTDLDEDIVQTAALLVSGEQTDEAAIDAATIEARVDLRDPDVAAARRAPARGADQARAPGARAGEGGGGGVHGRAGRHGDRAHAPRRATRSSTRRGAAAWRRSCSAPRSRR